MRTVLFAPGNGESLEDGYANVLDDIQQEGYKTEFVPISWEEDTDLTDWTDQMLGAYNEHGPEQTILAGFSYGAMIAFMAAARAEQKPSGLWLCSLSPFFAEDLPFVSDSWRDSENAHRREAFAKTSFDAHVGSISCRTVLLEGEKEAQDFPDYPDRFSMAKQAIRNCRALYIPGAGHDITTPEYRNGLRAAAWYETARIGK